MTLELSLIVALVIAILILSVVSAVKISRLENENRLTATIFSAHGRDISEVREIIRQLDMMPPPRPQSISIGYGLTIPDPPTRRHSIPPSNPIPPGLRTRGAEVHTPSYEQMVTRLIDRGGPTSPLMPPIQKPFRDSESKSTKQRDPFASLELDSP
jgi:hypothetical protein